MSLVELVGWVSRKVAGVCLVLQASADGENSLALQTEIVCNTIYCMGRFCL